MTLRGGGLGLVMGMWACADDAAPGDAGGPDSGRPPAEDGGSRDGGGTLAACTAPEGTRFWLDPTRPDQGEDAATWLTEPFPFDRRRNGPRADFSDYPDPLSSALLQQYRAVGSRDLDGFGLHAPIYLRFTGPLETASLPDAAGSRASDAALQLIDVDPDSPRRGERIPVEWRFYSAETAATSAYFADNVLAVAPVWGLGLRESTTYALVVTDRATDLEGRSLDAPELLQVALDPDLDCPGLASDAVEEMQAVFQPLADVLATDDLDAPRVRAATVFTTQSIRRELDLVRRTLEAQPAPRPLEDGWQDLGDEGFAERRAFQWSSTETAEYWVMEGRYDAPNFQQGQAPYAETGGRLNILAGEAVPVRQETLRFVLSIPTAEPDPCHPLVIYVGGTTGDAFGFTRSTAGRLAGQGLAAIGIDLPIHGLRMPEPLPDVLLELYSFNFNNPDSGRAVFRQGAIDIFSLVRLLKAGLTVPAAVSPTGAPICFDTSRLAFFGHSQGAMSGAIALGFETDIEAWVLSGAGGGLTITVLERKDPFDVAELLRTAINVDRSEPLDRFHPAVGLVQTLAEITDMVNYGAYWADGDAHVIATSAEDDAATPWRTATGLFLAGGLPFVDTAPLPAPGHDLLGLTPAASPVSGNADGRTRGFLQWAAGDGLDASHFVAFRRPEALQATINFLRTWSTDPTPAIVRDPNADIR